MAGACHVDGVAARVAGAGVPAHRHQAGRHRQVAAQRGVERTTGFQQRAPAGLHHQGHPGRRHAGMVVTGLQPHAGRTGQHLQVAAGGVFFEREIAAQAEAVAQRCIQADDGHHRRCRRCALGKAVTEVADSQGARRLGGAGGVEPQGHAAGAGAGKTAATEEQGAAGFQREAGAAGGQQQAEAAVVQPQVDIAGLQPRLQPVAGHQQAVGRRHHAQRTGQADAGRQVERGAAGHRHPLGAIGTVEAPGLAGDGPFAQGQRRGRQIDQRVVAGAQAQGNVERQAARRQPDAGVALHGQAAEVALGPQPAVGAAAAVQPQQRGVGVADGQGRAAAGAQPAAAIGDADLPAVHRLAAQRHALLVAQRQGARQRQRTFDRQAASDRQAGTRSQLRRKVAQVQRHADDVVVGQRMGVDRGRAGKRLHHRRGGGVEPLHHQAQRSAGLLQGVGQAVAQVDQAAGGVEAAADAVKAQELEAVAGLWHEAAEQLHFELAAERGCACHGQQVVAGLGGGAAQFDLGDRTGGKGQTVVEAQVAGGITRRQCALCLHRHSQRAAARQRGVGIQPQRAGASAAGHQAGGIEAAGVQVPGRGRQAQLQVARPGQCGCSQGDIEEAAVRRAGIDRKVARHRRGSSARASQGGGQGLGCLAGGGLRQGLQPQRIGRVLRQPQFVDIPQRQQLRRCAGRVGRQQDARLQGLDLERRAHQAAQQRRTARRGAWAGMAAHAAAEDEGAGRGRWAGVARGSGHRLRGSGAAFLLQGHQALDLRQ